MAQLTRGRRLMGEINVVPYIDVMLVLLIIFMVTAPLLAQGVKVELPKAAAEPLDPNAREPMLLSIDQNGLLYLNMGGKPEQAIDAETVRVVARRGSWAHGGDRRRRVLDPDGGGPDPAASRSAPSFSIARGRTTTTRSRRTPTR